MKNSARKALLMVGMVALVAGVAGCREEEQNRPLVKQKGVYQGVIDEKLDDELVSTLRSRSSGQRF